MVYEGAEIGKYLRRALQDPSSTLSIIQLTVRGGPSGYITFEMANLEIIRSNCTVSERMIILATGQHLLGKKGRFAWLTPGETVPDGIDPIVKIQTM